MYERHDQHITMVMEERPRGRKTNSAYDKSRMSADASRRAPGVNANKRSAAVLAEKAGHMARPRREAAGMQANTGVADYCFLLTKK
jgi:hypothetical protein